MITAQLPDGTHLQFPDGTADGVIDKVVKSHLQPEPSFMDSVKQGAGNLVAGAVRGAGSIGATLLAPVDAAARAVNNGQPINVGGFDIAGQDRRSGMDAGLQSMGAQPDSLMYKGGKLAGEVAGTAGAGGGVANLVTRFAPKVAQAAPAIVDALRTGGMSANGATGVSGVAARAAGGAANGAISAGLVNPEDAGTGAVIGGALPGVVQLVGKAGQAVGNSQAAKLAEQLKEFSRNAPKNDTVRQSLEAGYQIPPNMVNPSFTNQVIESISGKQATQQLASVKNEKVTGDLVRQALGIADDVPLTQSTLENLRKTAGKAYAEVADISPAAEMDLEALKRARNESNGWFKAYNRSASPDDLAKAKDAKDLAEVLEIQLESHATNAGKPELIPALRDARKQIAKTYTVGRAVNDAAGTIDARVLGRMYEKGLPLSDGLDVAGQFASAFPTVAKNTQQIGSPAAHNLKSIAAALMGGGGYTALGPAGAAAAAVPFVAPPMARALMFRKGAQEALVKELPQSTKAAALARLLTNPQAQQLLLKSAPAISAQ